MVVEKVRAALCREDERGEKEDLAWCWATNLELQSGALGPALAAILRDAARAKLRLAMKLIVCGVRGEVDEEERVSALQQLSNACLGERKSALIAAMSRAATHGAAEAGVVLWVPHRCSQPRQTPLLIADGSVMGWKAVAKKRGWTPSSFKPNDNV